jgi:NAD(P)-dependent dehydrogenase (short-subunit alcohol dehydrogenase family)
MGKKAVVISGAGSGIGAATAFLFAEKGHFVYLLGRDELKLQNVHKHIPNSLPIVCDQTKTESVVSAFAKINSSLGDRTIEVLVNNAGVFKRQSFAQGIDEDVWQEMFEVNILGAARLTRPFFQYFKTQGRGSIVNISSTLGLRPTEGVLAYSAAKAAMVNWTQGLALEGAHFGIRVNCICPGLVDTPIHSFHSLDERAKQKTLNDLGPLQPLGRVGTPREIAESVFFIGSELSGWTTGSVLSVDGGINLK